MKECFVDGTCRRLDEGPKEYVGSKILLSDIFQQNKHGVTAVYWRRSLNACYSN